MTRSLRRTSSIGFGRLPGATTSPPAHGEHLVAVQLAEAGLPVITTACGRHALNLDGQIHDEPPVGPMSVCSECLTEVAAWRARVAAAALTA